LRVFAKQVFKARLLSKRGCATLCKVLQEVPAKVLKLSPDQQQEEEEVTAVIC